MRVKYVSESDEPELHSMVEELAKKAKIHKPKIGISQLNIPNAFAFGSFGNHRVCITKELQQLLSKEELKAVVGHEISHIKNKDVAVITMLSIIPMILWYLAWSLLFTRDRDRGNIMLLGLVAFILYFITNLLVLYGSRIREYYADRGSIDLGSKPHALASALYKLVYGNAKANRQQLKQMEGYKAFFVNDPSKAATDIRELREIDKDLSGTVDEKELLDIYEKKLVLTSTDKLMELLSTHPNMLKRIRHLSALALPNVAERSAILHFNLFHTIYYHAIPNNSR
jgi:heat shock protein HtpX